MIQESISVKGEKILITTDGDGGAKGADTLASIYAKEHNIPIIVYKPNWKKYGRSAGIIRNKDIVNYCDKLVAFWDGKSKGTLNSINLSKKDDKLLEIVKHNK